MHLRFCVLSQLPILLTLYLFIFGIDVTYKLFQMLRSSSSENSVADLYYKGDSVADLYYKGAHECDK